MGLYDDAIDAHINEASQRHGVNPDIIRNMINEESRYNSNATSKKGAKGMMQLMPGTAKDMGVNDVNNPIQNIEGGIKYFSSMMKRYNGDTTKAVAAYNAGPKPVDQANGVPKIKETQNYVKKVLKGIGQVFEPESAFAEESGNKASLFDEASASMEKGTDKNLFDEAKKQSVDSISPPTDMSFRQGHPVKEAISHVLHETLPYIGMGVGAIPGATAGTILGAGPWGTAAGGISLGALGYAGGQKISDLADEYLLGLKHEHHGIVPELARTGKDVLEGAKIAGTAELAGGLVGKVAGTVARTPEAGKIEQSAGEELSKRFETPLKSIVPTNIAESERLKATVPGLHFSLASETGGLPSVVAGQKGLVSRSAAAKDFQEAQNIVNKSAISNALETIDTEGKTVDDTLRALGAKRGSLTAAEEAEKSNLESRVESINAQRQKMIAQAQDKADKAAISYMTTQDKEAVGKALREGVTGKQQGMRAAQNALYDAIPKDTVINSTGPLKKAVATVMGEDSKIVAQMYDKADNISKQVLDKLTEGQGATFTQKGALTFERSAGTNPLNVGELRAFDSYLSDLSRTASSQGDFNLARRIGIVRNGITETYESSGNKALTDVIGEATGYTKNQYAPLFRSQNAPSRMILDKDTSGAFRVTDAEVGKQFFQSGEKGVAAAKNYKEIFKADTEKEHLSFIRGMIDNEGPGLTRDATTKEVTGRYKSGRSEPMQKVVADSGYSYERVKGVITKAENNKALTSKEKSIIKDLMDATEKDYKKTIWTGEDAITSDISKKLKPDDFINSITVDEAGDMMIKGQSPASHIEQGLNQGKLTPGTAADILNNAYGKAADAKTPSERHDILNNISKVESKVNNVINRVVTTNKLSASEINPIREYIGRDFIDSAYADNSGWSGTRAQSWLDKNKLALKEYGLYDEFNQSVKTVRAAEQIKKELPELSKKEIYELPEYKIAIDATEKRKAFETSSVNKALNGDVDKFVDNLLSGQGNNIGGTIKQIKAEIGNNPSALNGLRQAFKERMYRAWQSLTSADLAGEKNLLTSNVERFFNKFDPALKELYSDKEYQTLTDVRAVISRIALQDKNVVKGSETQMFTQEEKKTKAIFDTLEHVSSKFRALNWFIKKFTNKEDFSKKLDDVLTRAYFDPDYARLVMDAYKYAKSPRSESKAATMLLRQWATLTGGKTSLAIKGIGTGIGNYNREEEMVPHPEGTKLEGPDGKIYTVKNGEAVLDEGQ